MTRLLGLLVASVLIVPWAASAQAQTNAPPGNSAIDEYLETVPAPSGNQRPRAPGSGGGVLTPAQRQRLEQQGADGKALADAVDATAPRGNQDKPVVTPPSAEGRSPLSEVIDAAAGRDGGGGMGMLLPAILIATLLGVITVVVLRRRSVS